MPNNCNADCVASGFTEDLDDDDVILDIVDLFPLDSSESVDSDGDGLGDNADALPQDASETVDTDGDGIGNNADTDDNGDGISDQYDQFPLETNQPPLQWQRFDDLLESVKGAVNQ